MHGTNIKISCYVLFGQIIFVTS